MISVGGGHAFGAPAIFLKAFLFNCTFDSFELLQIQYEDERASTWQILCCSG